ncbi:MAG: GntP family permease [Pseudomonadota bacterium]
MLGLFGSLLALGLLIWLAFRGISVIVLGPVMATIAAVFAAAPLLATYTQVFMPALGGFIVAYLPLFLLGAIFGRLMDASGFARTIADAVVATLGPERAILATVFACAVLTYGGVSLFVVAFAVYPIADQLFRTGGVPKRLLPAAIALGAFTFTMTALPGTPAIQNAIPMPFFGTTPFAAPGIGLITGAIMAVGGWLWLSRQASSAQERGEGYSTAPGLAEGDGVGTEAEPQAAPVSSPVVSPVVSSVPSPAPPSDRSLVSVGIASVPIVLVIALNYLLSVQVFPRLDTAYLAEPAYGATDIAAVRGIWAIIVGLLVAILAILATAREQLTAPIAALQRGAEDALLPLFNTASLVGFGAVVASLPAFGLVRAGIDGLSDDAVVSLAISSSVLAGLTGSASGGMTIALDALGADTLARATADGIDPALLHRVVALATGGLDALPHNGAVVTLLAICGLSHREAYGPVFSVAVAIPVLALAAAILLGSAFGAF